MKAWHMLLCGAFVVAGVALVAAGLDAVAFLPFVGCLVMMGAMVWMMRSGGRGDG